MDHGETIVDHLYSNFMENYQYLIANQQVSFANDYKDQFSKVILLSSASFFEITILDVIMASLNPSKCELTGEFIQNKALTRQYHTLFDWDKTNANKFFSLFGEGFKAYMSSKVKDDDVLRVAICDFLVIGGLRNQLAHKNYGTFLLQMTADEIYLKYKNAYLNFILKIPDFLCFYKKNNM